MLKQVFTSVKINTVLILPFLLAGCASTNWFGAGTGDHATGQTGPIAFKTKKPAVSQLHDVSHVEYQYVPVPVPGQLMAMPAFKKPSHGKHSVATGIKAVASANKKARVEPHSDQYFNSMLTYVYMPSAVYTIYTASGKITDIQLEQGEKILNIATADSANWQVQTSPSGEGKQQILHILIKPMVAEVMDNTLIVLTNKRVYHLYLKLTDNDTFMISVRWHYPDSTDSFFIKKKNPEKAVVASSDDSVNPSRMNFNYQWGALKSDRPEWFPVQVFNDGKKTYIRFPEDFTNQTTLPILYIPDGNGDWSTMTNWRLLNKNTMVIDGVLKEALLETGSKKGKRISVKIRLVANGQS